MPYYGTNGFYLPFSDNSSVTALGFDQSGDTTARVNATVFGDTKILTAQSKFGGSSAFFDGTGDYLSLPSNSDYTFGTGDFTVETWISPTNLTSTTFQTFVGGGSAGALLFSIVTNTGRITVNAYGSGFVFDQVFTFSSGQWYHLVATRQGTNLRVFVNGTQLGSTVTNSTNFSQPSNIIGGITGGTQFFTGYIDDLRIYKGVAKYTANFTPPTAALPLGKSDPLWQYCVLAMPMDGANNSTLFPAYAANSWTPLNLSVTAGAGNDSMIDSPTDYEDGGNGRGNYCTLDPLDIRGGTSSTLSNGNLDITTATASQWRIGTMFVYSGKWYCEYTVNANNNTHGFGITSDSLSNGSYYYQIWDSLYVVNSTTSSYGIRPTVGQVVSMALDLDAGTIQWFVNNSSQGTKTGVAIGKPYSILWNGSTLTNGGSFNFGQRPFAYTPPAGFKALNTANLPEPTIAKSNTQFDVVTYTGNGAQQTIGGLNFTPDLVWIKSRSAATDHALYDTVRGATKDLASNTTAAETTQAQGVTFGFPSQGGYAIGVFNGFMYIVSPKSTEVTRQWKTTNTATSGTASTTDGLANSNAMNDANHPAAQYCRGLTTGGFIDWYLPAKDELNFLYQNRANMPSGEGFVSDGYWSSTEHSSPSAWLQLFFNGTQYDGLKATPNYFRAVRRVPVNEYLSSLSGQSGFSIGSLAKINTNAATYVAWCWNAGETTTTNTAGSITSTVRANPSAGFSVVRFTSPSSGAYTFGHGLGITPSFVIMRDTATSGTSPIVYHTSINPGTSNYLLLSSTAAIASAAGIWGTGFTSNVLANAAGTGITQNALAIAYCFAPVAGFSSFGSYTGNGNANGPFVHLGFKPALVIIKMSSSTGNWVMMDNKRAGYNVDNDQLWANLTNVQGTADLIDFTANGFKVRSTDASVNTNAGTYVYMAWAEIPFKNSLAE
jgi:hypothetical protein